MPHDSLWGVLVGFLSCSCYKSIRYFCGQIWAFNELFGNNKLVKLFDCGSGDDVVELPPPQSRLTFTAMTLPRQSRLLQHSPRGKGGRETPSRT